MMVQFLEQQILVKTMHKLNQNKSRQVWKNKKLKHGTKQLGKQLKKRLKKSQNSLSNVISPNIKPEAPAHAGAFALYNFNTERNTFEIILYPKTVRGCEFSAN